ncbi:single-stranded DNA-binding protein [Aestuariimicrobium kwangyangense]|uniref:single-stranded DNA-binding protein n=1 Tax=Aestuariimicrobium kwangyangense TaxID=396389 RepID=UPI0003B69C9B
MDATISLSGNIGTDVETFTGDDWELARFRLACTPRVRRGGEWTDGETTWISVRASNRLARNVAASLHKGDPVVVTGRLRTHVWQDAEGVKQDRLIVEASSVGHDLNRGTTNFARNERVASPASPGEPVDRDDVDPEPVDEPAPDEQVPGLGGRD